MEPTGRRLTVVLAGEESAGVRVLRLLESAGHRVAAVLTTPPGERAGTSLWPVAEAAGHRVQPARRVRDPALGRELREDGVDLLLNVHSLHVVHPEVLRAPRLGSFNLHPGPLPELAGLNVVSWALYRGATEHGITVHEMVERIDAGGVAFEERFPVASGETAFSLYSKCIRTGVELVARLLATAAAEGRVPVRGQDISRRKYCPAGPPQEGRLDWHRTAREVHDFVRACDYGPFPSPWGHPRTRLEDRELEVLRVALPGKPADEAPGTVRAAPPERRLVACADEWVEVTAVRLDGERRPPTEVLPEGARLSSSSSP